MSAPAGNIKFQIQVIKGPHAGLTLDVGKDSVTIGRGAENDVVLALDQRVSRHHAEVKNVGREIIVTNLSQKNFLLVNGQNVQVESLNNESVITVGETDIKVRSQLFEKKVAPEIPLPIPAALPPQTPVLNPLNPTGQIMTPVAPFPQQFNRPQQGAHSPQPVRPQEQMDSGRVLFYVILGIIALVGYWLFSSSGNGKRKDPNAIRTSMLTKKELEDSEKRMAELSEKSEKFDNIQNARARENFIKGFRDFQQGQYARARDSFQVVLNLDPENQLAQRYLELAKIKFDEFVKFNMLQGNRYREKKNWRMCQSNYLNVMTLLAARRDDPTFREAKQYYDECSANLKEIF